MVIYPCFVLFVWFVCFFFFFKQKTAYEMRISDWSSDVCSSDPVKGMPIYEYECKKCGRVTEALQGFNDPPLKKCKYCKTGKLEKQIGRASCRERVCQYV